MNYVNEYRKKLVSADEAVKVVNSGDWIDYGSMCGQVVVLDEALARRKEELEDVKIWTLLTLRRPRVMDVDPEEESFVWHSWHLSAMARILVPSTPFSANNSPAASNNASLVVGVVSGSMVIPFRMEALITIQEV